MDNNPIVMMLIGLVAVMAILSFYPYLEGLLVHTGQEMATGANYTVSTTSADSVKDSLWAIGGPILILAFIAGLAVMMPRKQYAPPQG